MVNATNESTTGGARGTTHGSCLPPTCNLIDFFFLCQHSLEFEK